MADTSMNFKVITPDGEFYNDVVERVVIHTSEGDMGILFDHAPTTVALQSGICTITKDGKDIKGVIHGGFTEIKETGIILLPDAAEWPHEIDVERAKQAKERAEKRLEEDHESLDEERARRALDRAVTRIEVMEWYDHN